MEAPLSKGFIRIGAYAAHGDSASRGVADRVGHVRCRVTRVADIAITFAAHHIVRVMMR